MRTSPSPNTPVTLVGRDHELGILRDCLSGALTGQGSLVLIGGEAGIGKTALAEAVCREATEQSALVLIGRCYDLTETPPYGPWVEIFGRYRQNADLPPLPVAFAQRSTVGDVLSQAMLFQQVLDFLATAARHRPLVLLLDDLHWADPASLDLLRAVARSVAESSLLLLATYRADELRADHPLAMLLPSFVREARTERLGLRPLDEDGVRSLVTRRYQMSLHDTDQLTAYLVARAEGNCFFTQELLRALEEERILTRGTTQWQVGDLTAVSVPALLRQVISQRCMRLGADAQDLLAVAAVIGQEVPLTLWTAIAQTDEEALLTTIEHATQAHLATETADGTSVRFVHALVRGALYEGITPTRRRRLHREIGETLSTSSHPDPEAVAYHFRQAGDARAGRWLIKAGERAALAYAWLSAADRFEAALSLIEATELDAGAHGWLLYNVAMMRHWTNSQKCIAHFREAERLAAIAQDAGLAAYSVFNRGLTQCIAGNLTEGLAEMEMGVAARRDLPAAERERLKAPTKSLAMTDETDGQGPLIQWLATAGRYAEAREVGERVMAEAPAPSPSGAAGFAAYGDVFLGLGQVYAPLGLPDEAWRAFARAREAFRAIDYHFMVGQCAANETRMLYLCTADRPAVWRQIAEEAEHTWTRAHFAATDPFRRFIWLPQLVLQGQWDEARELALALRATRQTAYRAFARHLLGPLARDQGDRGLAQTTVQEAFPAGLETEPGDIFLLGALPLQRLAAALALDDGDLGTARRWLDAHDAWLSWSGAVLGQAEGQLGWVAYHRAAGEHLLAYQHAERALAHATEPRQPVAMLAAHRLLGELDTEGCRFADAQAHLDASLVLAEACQAPYERALALLAMAELRVANDKPLEVSPLLGEVRALCTPLGAGRTIALIDALASRLAVVHAIRPAFPAGLTTREVEVLRLIAAGKTNREIADALFLSPATVNIHVTHILTKTNAANRAEAAVFALRHGLA